MKVAKVFALFIVLHLVGWAAAHAYLSRHPGEILVVADTSYSMKPHFAAMENWITELESNSRYKRIIVGSDKALLGALKDLKSKSTIFRTAFGRINPDSLKRYDGYKSASKILLSDGSVKPDGWELIQF